MNVPRKGFDQRDQLIVTLYTYTIYLPLCTQAAVPKFTNHFRGTHCILVLIHIHDSYYIIFSNILF